MYQHREPHTIELMAGMITTSGLPVLKIEPEDEIEQTHACITVTDRISVDLVPEGGKFKAMIVRQTGNGDEVAFIFSNLYKWDAFRWVDVLHQQYALAEAEGPLGGAE